MCGIVGYVGSREAIDYLLGGLRRLEYRGYDSSGVAVINDAGELTVCKTAGRIEQLEACLAKSPLPGRTGIGHTRWATHGPPTDVNAHPHLGGDGELAVVHNGVIENFQTLKRALAERGLPVPLRHRHRGDRPPDRQLPEAAAAGRGHGGGRVRAAGHRRQHALAQLHGTYGLAIVFRDWPDVMIAARLGSPLVVGVGTGEHFVASDASPLAGYTDKIVYLADHELARDHGRAAAGHPSRPGARRPQRARARHRGGRRRHRATSSTTCSRRSSSSRSRSKTPCAAGSTGRGHGQVRRPEPRPAATPLGRSHHADRLRHQLARGPGGRVPDRGARPHPGRSRVRQRVPLSQSADGQQHPAVRHHAERRDGRHAGRPARDRSARGIPRWPSATSSAAPSPARPTAASICTPARRSASPPPRPLPRSARCWRCWPCTSAACGT